jgi:ferritin
MISKSVFPAMNDQIKHELDSAYLYLSMAAHFESVNLSGFAGWMKGQAGEEQEHAMKFFEHIHDRGGKVTVKALDQPHAEFGKPLAVFEQFYAHEQKVTALIHNLYSLALKENDYASQDFLTWFVKEQVEEEKHASEIVEKLKMAGDHPNALMMLDSILGKRGG